MKRLLLTSVLISLISIGSYAQVGDLRNSLSVGGHAGATASRVNFSPSIRQQQQYGATAGLALRYTSEKYFFLICAAQLEANFVQRGWNELIEDGSGNTYSRQTDYVEIPFLAHLGFGREARGVQGFVNLGPQMGFLLSDRETYGGQTPWDISNRPNGVTEQYNKEIENDFEYGITGGLGLELRTGIGFFTIEGRYYFGLSDMFSNSKKDYFGRSANSSIYARVAYMFEL